MTASTEPFAQWPCKFWLGRLREFPNVMTQGRTLKELEEKMRDAYQVGVLDDAPKGSAGASPYPTMSLSARSKRHRSDEQRERPSLP